jgi:hypothetical protein
MDAYGYAISPVRYVGDKTFVLHEGAWVDTTFDPEKMEPVPVSFGSDDYFALVAARPEWGRYLALGDHVIVVLEGTAYEVREGEAPALEVPPAGETPAAEPVARPTASAQATPEAEQEGAQTLVQAFGQILNTITEAIADLFGQ